ncbi:MAG: hypothetical protein JSR29_13335 [Nitrospira sp.]|nr:hypothetical protein [Nitrospira sp.]
MNSDNFFYALSVLPFLPYSKAAAKFVLSHSASLSLGLVAFLITKTLKGDAAMQPSQMKKPNVNDYLLAHPLALPFWVCGFVYLFFNLAADGLVNPLLVLLVVTFWLHSMQHSLTSLLEYHTAEERKEVLPCAELAKT